MSKKTEEAPTYTPIKTERGCVTPISALSPYLKNFTILGRILSITDVLKFDGKSGPGKVFNWILMDGAGDQI